MLKKVLLVILVAVLVGMIAVGIGSLLDQGNPLRGTYAPR